MAKSTAGFKKVAAKVKPPTPPDLAASAPTAVEEQRREINDEQFISEVNRLRNLTTFLTQEAVIFSLAREDSLRMGTLFTLRFNSQGQAPKATELAAVSHYTQLLFQLLTVAQRRRFLIGSIPSSFATLPVLFAFIALISLLISVLVLSLDLDHTYIGTVVLACYLFWLMSLGAIGSIAFIGMNALSVQRDITFDLLNPKLINLRIALGALFALVLTLLYGFAGFVSFIKQISAGGAIPNQDALMLVLPFLLGFSTSLVIMILNRLLDAVQSFFGKAGAPARTELSRTAQGTRSPTQDGGGSPRRRARRASS